MRTERAVSANKEKRKWLFAISLLLFIVGHVRRSIVLRIYAAFPPCALAAPVQSSRYCIDRTARDYCLQLCSFFAALTTDRSQASVSDFNSPYAHFVDQKVTQLVGSASGRMEEATPLWMQSAHSFPAIGPYSNPEEPKLISAYRFSKRGILPMTNHKSRVKGIYPA